MAGARQIPPRGVATRSARLAGRRPTRSPRRSTPADPGCQPRRRPPGARRGRGARARAGHRPPLHRLVRDRQRARPLQRCSRGLGPGPSSTPASALRPERYIRDFSRWAGRCRTLPLAGPAFASSRGSTAWASSSPPSHAYDRHLPPLSAARLRDRPDRTGLPDDREPAVGQLLGWRWPSRSRPTCGRPHRQRCPFRVGEMNSASCTGKRGRLQHVRLRAVDARHAVQPRRVGVDGVNVHTLPARRTSCSASPTHGRWRAFVHPEYYGMLLFAHAFPPGAQLLPVSAPAGPVKVWATRERPAARASC